MYHIMLYCSSCVACYATGYGNDDGDGGRGGPLLFGILLTSKKWSLLFVSQKLAKPFGFQYTGEAVDSITGEAIDSCFWCQYYFSAWYAKGGDGPFLRTLVK